MKTLKKIWCIVNLAAGTALMLMLLATMKMLDVFQRLVWNKYPQYAEVLSFESTWDDVYASYAFVCKSMQHKYCWLAELAR